MQRIPRLAVVNAVKAAIFLPVSVGCLWWAYSMHAQVNGGHFTLVQAQSLSVKMALVMTVLASVVWFISPYLHKSQRLIGLALKTTLETALILTIYLIAVLVWRNNWTPAKGMTDEAAFMPIVGHINAAFLAEFLWLEFLVVVIPIVSVLSGFLALLLDRMQSTPQLRRNAGFLDHT